MRKSKVRKLSRELKESAIQKGMCDKGIIGWLDYESLDDLCEHYREGIEFILNHPGWPSNSWLIENVGRDILHRHGIYINDNAVITKPSFLVFNGACNCDVVADGFSTPELYVRDNSVIDITLTDVAIAHVNVYDDSRVAIHCDEYATCYVYQYGGSVKGDGNGAIKVKYKANLLPT